MGESTHTRPTSYLVSWLGRIRAEFLSHRFRIGPSRHPESSEVRVRHGVPDLRLGEGEDPELPEVRLWSLGAVSSIALGCWPSRFRGLTHSHD